MKIPLTKRFGGRKGHNDQPPVKSLTAIAQIFRNAVARKDQPCRGLEGERIFIFALGSKPVLPGDAL